MKASGTAEKDQRDAMNWEPDYCPQCGSDAPIIHQTSFGPQTDNHRGIRWTISCPACGGLFDIDLRTSIDTRPHNGKFIDELQIWPGDSIEVAKHDGLSANWKPARRGPNA